MGGKVNENLVFFGSIADYLLAGAVGAYQLACGWDVLGQNRLLAYDEETAPVIL
jgi:hypothetical protein